MLNIIHDFANTARYEVLMKELKGQGLTETDYVLHQATMDTHMARRGISRSHKAIVRKAKEDGLEYVFIAEDDLHFLCSNSYTKFQDILGYFIIKDIHWDILLGGFYNGLVVKEYNNKFALLEGKFAGLICYAVHKRYFDLFLSADENYNIDHWISEIGLALTYSCYPQQIIQHDGLSSNTGQQTAYNADLGLRFKLSKCE